MTLTPWKMTLTLHADKAAVLHMRDYLRERGIVVPMRDRDVVTKCTQRFLENGFARTSIAAASVINSPSWLRGDDPTRRLEDDFWTDLGLTRSARARLIQLAQGTCGLLVMLACYVAFCR